MLITAVDVVNTAAGTAQLVPMLEQAEEMTGERVPVTLANGGYHTAANLKAGERRGDLLVMPERNHTGVQGPYFTVEVSAGTTVRFRDHSESIELQRPCVALALPTGFVPKTCMLDAHCGSGRPTSHSRGTGSGSARMRPGGATPGVRSSASPPSASSKSNPAPDGSNLGV